VASVRAFLFGKFHVDRDGQPMGGMEAGKVKELFSCLLINRGHPQSRGILSELLWGNQPDKKSRKYLRQTLWRLQSAIKASCRETELDLVVDDEWIQLNPSAALWLDIADFEQIFDRVKHKKAREMMLDDYTALEHAVNLYQGDLLEGWYRDWCLFERERFQGMHFTLLDKLVQYCEAHRKYDAGLAYGAEILRNDRAYERTHRQLMRLFYMAGDRTQALHQYERCVTALRDELGVEPSERTKWLYEQIRSDAFTPPPFAIGESVPTTRETTSSLTDTLDHLKQFSEALVRIQFQVQNEITTLESKLSTDK
jgi:DNA-binding SARP family transcriptional activator